MRNSKRSDKATADEKGVSGLLLACHLGYGCGRRVRSRREGRAATGRGAVASLRRGLRSGWRGFRDGNRSGSRIKSMTYAPEKVGSQIFGQPTEPAHLAMQRASEQAGDLWVISSAPARGMDGQESAIEALPRQTVLGHDGLLSRRGADVQHRCPARVEWLAGQVRTVPFQRGTLTEVECAGARR